MLRDADFFRSRISKLDGAADIGDHLVGIINAKAVAEKSKALETNPTEPISTTTEKGQEEGEKV